MAALEHQLTVSLILSSSSKLPRLPFTCHLFYANCLSLFCLCFSAASSFGSYPSCSGARAPGLAADMHFKDDVIAFIGPACAFALEPVARLAAYWNTPIITGMGDQASTFSLLLPPPHSTWFAIRCSPREAITLNTPQIKPEISTHYSPISQSQPPSSEGELTVTSGILGRIHKWKNESTVSED